MSHPDSLAAVLDANVLYPQWLRDVMLTLAAMGYFDPVWSQTIIDEMRRNVLADHSDIAPDRFDAVTIAALRRAFPDAWVHVDPALIAQMDNAPQSSTRVSRTRRPVPTRSWVSGDGHLTHTPQRIPTRSPGC